MPRCSCVMPRPQRHHGSCSGEAAGAGGRAQSRAGGRAAGARGRGSAAAAVASVLLRAGGLADLGGGLKLSSAEPASCCGGQLRRAGFQLFQPAPTPARQLWQHLDVGLGSCALRSLSLPQCLPPVLSHAFAGLWGSGSVCSAPAAALLLAAAASTLPPPQAPCRRRKALFRAARLLLKARAAWGKSAGRWPTARVSAPSLGEELALQWARADARAGATAMRGAGRPCAGRRCSLPSQAPRCEPDWG